MSYIYTQEDVQELVEHAVKLLRARGWQPSMFGSEPSALLHQAADKSLSVVADLGDLVTTESGQPLCPSTHTDSGLHCQLERGHEVRRPHEHAYQGFVLRWPK